MGKLFAETLKRLRMEKGLSQRELAEQIYVTQSTVARWENGSRLPDTSMMSRLSGCLDVDINTLLNVTAGSVESPNVILVEDREIILTGSLTVLREAMPDAVVTGFSWPSDAMEYASNNRVSLAFLDIELGNESGLDLCNALLNINPRTNVVFLTAYAEYSLDAWDTGASGFMLKPLTAEGVQAQLANLRHPFSQERIET